VDCGGQCPACGIGKKCSIDGDCNCGKCINLRCKGVCGDGVKCSDEACDDGHTSECGTCNADCTGPGTPLGSATCGDGKVCTGRGEVCDDGHTSECGPCNADCTGPGTALGSATCGDGKVCPEKGEVCDDGHQTACGACNADCSGPGTPTVCGDGVVCPDTE